MRFTWSLTLLDATAASCILMLGMLAAQAVLPLSAPAAGTPFVGLIYSSWDYCFASYYLFSHTIYLVFTLIPPLYVLSKQLVTTQANTLRHLSVFIGACLVLLVYIVEGLSVPLSYWQTGYAPLAVRDDQPLYSVSHIFLILTPYVVWLWILWVGYGARLHPSSCITQGLSCLLGLPILPALVIAMFFGGLWSLYNDFALLVWSWDYIELFALDNVWWYSLLAHAMLRSYSPLLLISVTLLVLRLFRMSFLESTHHLTGAGSMSDVDTLIQSLGSCYNHLPYSCGSCLITPTVLFILAAAVRLPSLHCTNTSQARPPRSRFTWVSFLFAYQTLFFLYAILRILSTVPAMPEWASTGGFVFTTYFGYFWFLSALLVLFVLAYPRILAPAFFALIVSAIWFTWPVCALLSVCLFPPLLNALTKLLLYRLWPHMCSIILFLCFVALAAHTYLISFNAPMSLLVSTNNALTGVNLLSHGSINGLPGWLLSERPFYSLLSSGSVWGGSYSLENLWLFSLPAGSVGVFILTRKYYFFFGRGNISCAGYNVNHSSSCLYAWP